MVKYDIYYKKERYFGNPCPQLINFFEKHPVRGRLCDLGAGQGRDSVPLSDLGYSVTAVDVSKTGLKQISDSRPEIETRHEDIYAFDVSGFDFILLDSMLHFYKRDASKETSLVNRVLSNMKVNGIFVNNMIKSAKAEKIMKNIIGSADGNFDVIEENYIDYPYFNSIYHFIVIEKRKY